MIEEARNRQIPARKLMFSLFANFAAPFLEKLRFKNPASEMKNPILRCLPLARESLSICRRSLAGRSLAAKSLSVGSLALILAFLDFEIGGGPAGELATGGLIERRKKGKNCGRGFAEMDRIGLFFLQFFTVEKARAPQSPAGICRLFEMPRLEWLPGLWQSLLRVFSNRYCSR